jgi:hypothetical protein
MFSPVTGIKLQGQSGSYLKWKHPIKQPASGITKESPTAFELTKDTHNFQIVKSWLNPSLKGGLWF